MASPGPNERRRKEEPGFFDDPEVWIGIGLGVGLVAFGPFVAIAGAISTHFVWRNIRRALLFAVAGLALVALFWLTGLVEALWFKPWERALRHGLFGIFDDPGRAWRRAAPEIIWGWLLFLPLAPLVGIAADAIREKKPDEELKRKLAKDSTRERRRLRRADRRLARHNASAETKSVPAAGGFPALGQKIRGDDVLPTRRGSVFCPPAVLGESALVVGSTGAGKTETMLRLGFCLGHTSEPVPLHTFDAKPDPRQQKRYAAIMGNLGKSCLRFPQEALDVWRGEPLEVASRLMQVVDFSREGDGAWHTDRTRAVVELAFQAPRAPVASSGEFLGRLDRDWLLEAYAGRPQQQDVRRLDKSAYESAWARFHSFFSFSGGLLDGERSWEDVDSSYVLLDSAANREQAQALCRILGADYLHYVTRRKRSAQQALLFWDEFSALSRADEAIHVAERTRSAGGGVVLASQSVAALGDEREQDRLRHTVGTVFLHQCPDPEALVHLAGTRPQIEGSIQHLDGYATGLGSARVQDAFRVDPNDVRQLLPGGAWVIRKGSAMKLKVARAPALKSPRMVGEGAPPAMPRRSGVHDAEKPRRNAPW